MSHTIRISLLTTTALLWGACWAESTLLPTPISDAGADQKVAVGSWVTLDGSGSTDPLGYEIQYEWQLLHVPSSDSEAITLKESDSAGPHFTASLPGEYLLGLRVEAGGRTSSLDTVSISAFEETSTNRAPVARAGDDTMLCSGEQGRLIGNRSFDPDPLDTIISYQWQQVDNGAPLVTITSSSSVNATFIAPAAGETPLRFQLTVSDGELEGVDTVDIYIRRVVARPTVQPSTAQSGNQFTLSSGDSCYPASITPSYHWRQVVGSGQPTISLSNSNSASAVGTAPDTADSYTFELTVTADSSSDSDTVQLTVANGN